MKSNRRFAIGAVLFLGIAGSMAQAQIGADGRLNYNGGTITQSFNALGTANSTLSSLTAATWTSTTSAPTGGTGWIQQVSGGAANATTAQTADNGSLTTAGFYNYGTTAAADRALGSLTTTNVQYLGLELFNNTAQAFPAISLQLTVERWRSSTLADTLTLEYRVSATPLTTLDSGGWNALSIVTVPASGSAAATDGNLAANQFTANLQNSSLGATPWNAATYLYLRFSDATTGAAGLGVDNLAFAAVPEPSTWIGAALLVGFVGVSAMKRARARATVA